MEREQALLNTSQGYYREGVENNSRKFSTARPRSSPLHHLKDLILEGAFIHVNVPLLRKQMYYNRLNHGAAGGRGDWLRYTGNSEP